MSLLCSYLLCSFVVCIIVPRRKGIGSHQNSHFDLETNNQKKCDVTQNEKKNISNTKGSSTTQYYGSNSTPCEYNAIKICVNIPPSALLATRHAQNGQTYMDQHQHFHTTQVYKCSSQQPNVALISKAMLKKGADMSSKLDNFLVDFCKKSGALNCFFLIKPKIQWLSNIVS